MEEYSVQDPFCFAIFEVVAHDRDVRPVAAL